MPTFKITRINCNKERKGGEKMNNTKKQKRGFAGMAPDKQRDIASKGGRAAHRLGSAHEFTSEEGRRAGQKGGKARARNSARKTNVVDTLIL